MAIGGSAHEGEAGHDVSGVVTGVIVRAVRAVSGEAGVHQVLAIAGERRSAQELEEASTWTSHEGTVSLLTAAAAVTGDTDVARHVGQAVISQHQGTEMGHRLRALGSPAELVRSLALAADSFTTVSSFEPTEVGRDYAIVRSAAPPGHPRHPYLCELTKGMLSQVTVLFGLAPAPVAETECQARGGRFCDYHLGWSDVPRVPPPPRGPAVAPSAFAAPGSASAPQSRVAPAAPGGRFRPDGDDRAGDEGLENERVGNERAGNERAGDERLLEAYQTVDDVVGELDLADALGHIARRAARALDARAALFVIKLGPGEPLRYLHHGLDDLEVRRLGAALLEMPDVPDGGVGVGPGCLVVDVASARQVFGRLGVFTTPGSSDPAPAAAGHDRTLAFYAASAALTMELSAVRTEAQDHEATVESVLGFARQLADLATVRQVAQALATRVPAVVGADDASVLLWDSFEQRLAVEARASVGPDAQPGRGQTTPDAGGFPAGDGPAPVDGPGHLVLSVRDASGGAGPDEPQVGADALDRSPVIGALMGSRGLAVVDRTTQDAFVGDLLERHGADVALLAPLCSGDEFLGLVSAEFAGVPPVDLRSDGHLRDRLTALADQAVVAFQNASLVEQIGDQALHDALTGLPNRRLLIDRTEQELARTTRAGEASSLLHLDLDRLSRVNEALGHQAGDELLRQVAQRLRSTVRDQDTVARLGGDELTVLLVGQSDRIAVLDMAERLLEALRQPFRLAGAEVFTSASIGIAIAPQHGTTYDELASHAADAVRRSKENGRNTYTMYSDAGDNLSAYDAQLRTDLRHALEREELFVLYQPYIDLQTTQVVGVEALVRWLHPTRGVLEPAAFILQAEETDLIVGIDLFVMREACRQMRRWADEGVTPLRMSVNISARDLLHPGFVNSVTSALRDHGVPPEWLELEITERVTTDGDGVMHRTAEQLRQLGVRFSLDDFGTGSSSLQQMAAFPVSTLKIDRSFVQLVGPPDELSSLALAIIGLAERLGLDCVAEGVETSRQSRVLLQRGCNTAQGYFFSPPLLPNDVKRMLQSPMRPSARAATPGSPPFDGSGRLEGRHEQPGGESAP
jgi:diguanylate cyclase (GGDEF)-like protein